MRFTRARDLVIAGLVAAVAVNALLRVGYQSLPPLPMLAGATLLLLAVAEALYARWLRARIVGRDRRTPVRPQVGVLSLALAKSSSLFGAIMSGVWLALLVYVLPRRDDMDVAAGDIRAGVVGLVSAALLIVAALWLEHCCRTPEDPDPRGESRSSGS